MRMIVCVLMLAITAFPLRAQFSSGGLQDGAHGSGGDEKPDYITAVNAGWNIVSVPIAVGDYLTSAIYPTAVSPAYSYDNGYNAEFPLQDHEAGAAYEHLKGRRAEGGREMPGLPSRSASTGLLV